MTQVPSRTSGDEAPPDGADSAEPPVVVAPGTGRVLAAEPAVAGRAGKVPDDPAVLAAIVAAADACWPVAGADNRNARQSSPWRFSGRTWRTLAQARRERP